MSAAAPIPTTPRKRQTGGVVMPHQPKWHSALAAWIIFAVIRAVSATLRYRWNDRSGFFNGAPPGPAIYCVWHNRLALACRPIAVISTAHRRQGSPRW